MAVVTRLSALGASPIGSGRLVAASTSLLGGSQLIVWLVLALGGAMLVGNAMALLRPRTAYQGG